MTKPKRQKSVLVIRLSHVTDVVLASPMAHLIKRHADNVHLTWLVESRYADLLQGHPDIDKLIPWDKHRWLWLLKRGKLLGLLREVLILRRLLRRRDYELALDLQGLMVSSFFAWLGNARIRISLGATQASNWFVTKTISRNIGEETQLGSEYRYLLSQLGMPDSPWQIYISPPDKNSTQLEEQLGFNYTSENYAVICPFSVFPDKRWPDDHWKQIALRIRGRYQLKTVIVGLERDAKHGETIASAIGAITLAGKTTLNEATEVIRHSKLVLGIDTGLTHIGHAFQIPTIGLFGPTCPYSYAGVETSKIIFLKRYCAPCNNKPICKGRFECMNEITPDMVLSELKPLMKLAQEH